MYSCSKCHKVITERTVSMCDNRFWHTACLTCQMCGHTPSAMGGESLYSYRGSLICKSDYMRMTLVCKTCSQPITQSDLVIRAKNYGYMHDKCVFCGRCRHRLETGDRYMLTTDNTIVCQKCIMQVQQGPPPAVTQQYAPSAQSPHGHPPMHMHHPMGPGGPNTGPPPPPNAYGGNPNQSPHPMMSSNGYNNGMNGGMSAMNHHQIMARNGVPNQPTPPPPVSASGNTTTTTGRRGRKRANML